MVGNVGGEGRSNSVDNCSDNLIFIPRRTSKSIQAFVYSIKLRRKPSTDAANTNIGITY